MEAMAKHRTYGIEFEHRPARPYMPWGKYEAGAPSRTTVPARPRRGGIESLKGLEKHTAAENLEVTVA
jgi:hypothetical protein